MKLKLHLQVWTLKYLPLLPHIRRDRQIGHLRKCMNLSNEWEYR